MSLPTIDHAGFLEDLEHVPGFLVPGHAPGAKSGRYSCAFCGLGDGAVLARRGGVPVATPTGVAVSSVESLFTETMPTRGCVKLRVSSTRQRTVFPIHVAPSVLDRATGTRRTITYAEAIDRLADLLLQHRPPAGRTLVYACGQIDYFAIFAFQEVFRLLGVRNLAGNAEHCLNAGAVHNELLTGQEGPFLTIDQALEGPDRFYLLNGWNGLVTHPPAFHAIVKRKDLDAYLVEVAVTESARKIEQRLGRDRVLLVRPGSDPHLALAVAHEVLTKHAVDRDFVERFASAETFDRWASLAREPRFSPEEVASRIAPEARFVERLVNGIRDIAAKLARPGVVPINVPSVGLSQTKGAVAHALWGSVLGAVGKYGLRPDGSPAGGTVRFPGQINAQTEVQGLSRRAFMGRIPVTEDGAREVALRMGLPPDAYAKALADVPRAALDYSDPTTEPELFLCFGTQFESNMLGRARWIEKLRAPGTTLVAIDPVPDPFTLATAELVIPSPPHPAAAKLYQNGEWRLTLSTPQVKAPRETRTDATIVYDAMAAVARKVRANPALAPDLVKIDDYVRARFEDLPRIDGEVSRPVLWQRVLDYMADGPGRSGALYCRPEHADGRPVTWEELLAGPVVYGGVGTTRFKLEGTPFRDVYRRPRRFAFFVPTERDLAIPQGVVLGSGRSTLTDDPVRVRFASSTFNSGKATTAVDMPAENPVHVSLELAARRGIRTGDRVRLTGVASGRSLVLPAVVTDRLAGDQVYVSFHKCRAEIDQGRYLNDLTSHVGRCPYTSQSDFKATLVEIARVGEEAK